MNLDNHDLLARFGLKWNPFAPDIPVHALWRPDPLEHFCWRMQAQIREGGFALITGDPAGPDQTKCQPPALNPAAIGAEDRRPC